MFKKRVNIYLEKIKTKDSKKHKPNSHNQFDSLKQKYNNSN